MNVENIKNCFGCGLCAVVCAKKVIDIQLSIDGFYEPVFVNPDACTNCGLCVDVCSYQDTELALTERTITSYGAWSNDTEVRGKCSSGGVAFELGRLLLSKGYKVLGVKYDPNKEIVLHYIAENERELEASIGSKYIQSYTLDAFKQIDRKSKYLVTGSPCQIDSFRRYIKKLCCEDNFVLMDFFCHGVPSMLMWNKYLADMKAKHGIIDNIVWRNKKTGWHDSWSMNAYVGDKELQASLFSKGDAFYRLFLGDGCLGCACYDKCKFKYDQSSADIRIDDAWGTYYSKNEKGVNAVVTFTNKGESLLHECNVELDSQPFSVIAESQMKKPPLRIRENESLMATLKDVNAPLSDAIALMDKHDAHERLLYKVDFFIHPLKTVSRIIYRIKMMLGKV